MTDLDALKTLTVEEVAGLLGTCPETVRRYVRTGRLGAAAWGGRLHFRPSDVAAFQAASRVRRPDPERLRRPNHG